MKKLLLIMLPLLLFSIQMANGQEIEELRAQGYEARIAGDLQLSIEKYAAVLKLSEHDYDAKLALGRLYLSVGEYQKAIDHFELIYKYDTTDVEAMFGFGKAYIWLDQYPKAIYWLSKAVEYLPDFAPAYLELGRVYGYAGKLDSAIWAYQKVIDIDPSYSTAWAGIGRMHYWNSKPVTAAEYYKKALEIDPENQSIKEEYEKIKKELSYKTGATLLKIQEKEPGYVIDALIQRYTVSKRFADRWMAYASISFDHSQRDFSHDVGDTTRWYDNSWAKITHIREKDNFSAYAGFSVSDNVLSTYGLSWNHRERFGKIRISNTITAGYSYFYYWKQAGKQHLNENLNITRKKWNLALGAAIGKVDDAPIQKYRDQELTTGENPYTSLNATLNYSLTKKPLWKIGATWSHYDFDFLSPDYYTPYNRILYGPVTSLQYRYKGFYIYASFAWMLGEESFFYADENNPGTYIEDKINVDNWSGSFDMAYSYKRFIFSVGGSRFVNPFYENYTLYTSIRCDL